MSTIFREQCSAWFTNNTESQKKTAPKAPSKTLIIHFYSVCIVSGFYFGCLINHSLTEMYTLYLISNLIDKHFNYFSLLSDFSIIHQSCRTLPHHTQSWFMPLNIRSKTPQHDKTFIKKKINTENTIVTSKCFIQESNLEATHCIKQKTNPTIHRITFRTFCIKRVFKKKNSNALKDIFIILNK